MPSSMRRCIVADLARLDLARYIHTLSAQLVRSYTVDPQRIAVQIQVEPVILDIDQAIPCGLILNELEQCLQIRLSQNHRCSARCIACRRSAALVVRDNGNWVPGRDRFRHTESLGLQLIAMLTEQLQGTIALERRGTTFTLTFPVRNVEA